MDDIQSMGWRLASRMTDLLLALPKEDRAEAMSEVDRLLSEADMDTSLNQESPSEFARSLFLGSNPVGRLLAKAAVAKQKDPMQAESPTDLLLSLLPSDSHLM